MPPAQQSLGADHLAGGDVDARLVDEEQLAAADALAQLGGQRGGGGGVLVEQRREELVAVAAALLGAVHGDVGEPHQRADLLAVLRHAGDADARAGEQLAALCVVRPAELVDQLLRHRGGLARLGDVLQQHAELVAADARDEVVAAHRGAQARGDHLEQAVAHLVAERVVDLLEVVQVEEQQRRGLVVAPRVRHRLAGALGEHGAVGQAGKRIVVREELESARIVLQLLRGEAQVLLRALERGHVAPQHVEAGHRAAPARCGTQATCSVRRRPPSSVVSSNSTCSPASTRSKLPRTRW